METKRSADSTFGADTETFRQAAMRLERAGLVIDRAALSPAHRRAFFALQRQHAAGDELPEPQRSQIGFPYPNPR